MAERHNYAQRHELFHERELSVELGGECDNFNVCGGAAIHFVEGRRYLQEGAIMRTVAFRVQTRPLEMQANSASARRAAGVRPEMRNAGSVHVAGGGDYSGTKYCHTVLDNVVSHSSDAFSQASAVVAAREIDTHGTVQLPIDEPWANAQASAVHFNVCCELVHFTCLPKSRFGINNLSITNPDVVARFFGPTIKQICGTKLHNLILQEVQCARSALRCPHCSTVNKKIITQR